MLQGRISLTAHVFDVVVVKAIDFGQGAPNVTSPSAKGGVNHWESAGLSLTAFSCFPHF